MPDWMTAGFLSAWKLNAHVVFGPENPNASLGVAAVNVPLSLYEMMSAWAGAQQRAKTDNNDKSGFRKGLVMSRENTMGAAAQVHLLDKM